MRWNRSSEHLPGRQARARVRLLPSTAGVLLFAGIAVCAAFLLASAPGSGKEPGSGDETAAGAAGALYRLHSDIRYPGRSARQSSHLLDVYVPTRRPSGRMPVIVWIHGGGWYQGNKVADIGAKASTFTRAGFVFVSINYRLSPNRVDPGYLKRGRVMYPDQPVDAAAAIGWVSRHIARFGGDRRRIVLMGHSAGGQIASLIATQPRFLRARRVNPRDIRGVISLDSFGLDVASLADPARLQMPLPMREMFWNEFGTPLEEGSPARWARASALANAGRDDPPFLLVVSKLAGWRVVEAGQMAARLGQRHDRAVLPVDLDHRQINLYFGTDLDRERETRRALVFARYVTGRARVPRPIVRAPKRRFAIARRERTRDIVLSVRSRPRGAPMRCRLDRRQSHECGGPRTYRVARGPHTLVAVAIDPTGRSARGVRFRFRVGGPAASLPPARRR